MINVGCKKIFIYETLLSDDSNSLNNQKLNMKRHAIDIIYKIKGNLINSDFINNNLYLQLI